MKKISKYGLLVSAATLLASIILTTTTKAVSYTASGTTDARTARLFNSLLKNSRHLQVHTEVHPSSKRIVSAPKQDVMVNYTVTGKTDAKTARKLIQLFRTSKHVEVVVDVFQHLGSNAQVQRNYQNNFYNNNNQRMNAGTMPIYQPNYPGVYVRDANNLNYWRPVTMWQKVPVSTPYQQANVNHPFSVAGK